MDELSSMDVQEILIAEGCLKRRKEGHTYKQPSTNSRKSQITTANINEIVKISLYKLSPSSPRDPFY